MKRIFVTGVSGTGKTTIAHILKSRGINSISIDEEQGLCYWKNKVTGNIVDYEAVLDKEFIDKHDWVCDITRLKSLIDSSSLPTVVLGIATNQNDFLDLFDKIILLQCKPETFIKRIMQRTDNDFGKDKSAQEYLLKTYKDFEEGLLRRGARPINVDDPIERVVELVMEEIDK